MTRSMGVRRLVLVLGVVLATLVPVRAKAQTIYISYESIRKFMRFEMGVGHLSIGGLAEPVGSLSAWGLHLSNEVRIVSAFMEDRPGLRAWDSFFLDLQMGGGSGTDAVKDVGGLAIGARFGYQLQLGWRTEKWAAFGGLRYQYTFVDVGSSYASGGSWPAVVRGEYKLGEKRFAGQLWGAAWGNKAFGAQVDVPIYDDYWFITARYSRVYADDSLAAYGLNFAGPGSSYGSQVFLGLRMGNPI